MAIIGYIIGILVGLYFTFSIVLFYILGIAMYVIMKTIFIKKDKFVNSNQFKLISSRRYFRYIKLILNQKAIFCIIIFSIISNTNIIFQNKKYENLYKDEQIVEQTAIIVSNKQEKEYHNQYKIKLCATNLYLYLEVDKKSTNELEYGDKIKFKGKFAKPTSQRNYGGFDYQNYLKMLKICGTVKAETLQVVAKKKANFIFSIANQINIVIKQKIDSNFKEEEANILKGVLLGDTTQIEQEIQEKFRVTNISHILAVSGMHITYLIIGINVLFQSKIGKRGTGFLVIVFLIFYLLVTGFSPSVVRAGVMGILVTGAKIFYRKNDTWTSLAISLFCILIYHPFLITHIGLQFSYLGTIGMLLFHQNVLTFLRNRKIKNRKWKYKWNRKFILVISKVKEILAVTISAQLAILPVMLYHFNLFGTYFLFTNFLVSLIMGPIIIIGGITIVISFCFPFVPKLLIFILRFLIHMLLLISHLGELPFAKIYIPTPKIWMILLYYFFLLMANFIYPLYQVKKLTYTQMRGRNLMALAKYKLFQHKKKYATVMLSVLVLFLLISMIPKKLEIHFVDVGQGDCTFIQTPHNKTILIDGGGSSSIKFEVGRNILLPYILDRGYTQIDYVFISHFDQDHVGGIFTILKELKIGKVIISRQGEDSENYQEFLKIIKDRKIAVELVKMGDRVTIEKALYFDILWPSTQFIQDNILNNNSIVMKLNYQNFSMLFTGDIEEKSERKVLDNYKGKESKLASKVLKVAHHGSKTSSMEEILKVVQPRVALIGVGKNNLFKHPSEITIKNLERYRITIYRTDEKGEITLKVNKNGKFEIKTMY